MKILRESGFRRDVEIFLHLDGSIWLSSEDKSSNIHLLFVVYLQLYLEAPWHRLRAGHVWSPGSTFSHSGWWWVNWFSASIPSSLEVGVFIQLWMEQQRRVFPLASSLRSPVSASSSQRPWLSAVSLNSWREWIKTFHTEELWILTLPTCAL